MSDTPADAARRPLISRWWVPMIPPLIGLTVFLLLRTDVEVGSEQRRNMQVFGAVAFPALAMLLWFVLFAPVRRRVRFGVGLGIVLAAITLNTLYVIEGVDGDLKPIIRARFWGRTAVKPVVANQPPSAAQADPTKPVMPPVVEPPSKDDGKSPVDPAPPVASNTNDFPQFLGPDRTGVLTGPRLHRDWTTKPPIQRWRRDIGAGWSAFAVQGGRAVTQEQQEGDELVTCYDLNTGEPLWTHRDAARYANIIAGTGPRATPTIHGDRVLTLGATGLLNCLDLATGRRHWSADIIADHDAQPLVWGIPGSPLVDGDRVIVTPGGTRGSVAAYDLATGRKLWAQGGEATNYASPVIVTLLGKRQLLIQNDMTLTAHDPADGRLLWSHPTPGNHPKVSQPLPVSGDRILISSGYGTGSDCFQLIPQPDGTITTKSRWKNIQLKSKFAHFVQYNDHIYGLNDGTLVCLRADDGSRVWRGERYGHGQLLLVNDLLLITTESGDVVLVEATPADFRELTRFHAFDDKTWNPPALAGRLLLIRNDREAACFELPGE